MELDSDLWKHAYTNESIDSPKLVRSDVLKVASKILELKLGINRKDINEQNCLVIFQLLKIYFI